jgi:hypothetical protein
MSLMEPITKAADPLKDPKVIETLGLVRDAQLVPEMEVALLELALAALDDMRPELERKGKAAVKEQQKQVTKLARATTRMVLADPSRAHLAKAIFAKNQWITIPQYERRDGTLVEEHKRRLPEGSDAKAQREWADIADELEQAREYQRGKEPSTERQWAIASIDASLEGAYSKLERSGWLSAVEGALQEKSIGRGILSVSSFFAEKTNQLRFAAAAIREFGFLAGLRVTHAYFRYGGYDVPLNREGTTIKTEMGDVLPPVQSQEASRHWAIETLRKRLPGAEADRSNAEPPSEGFIIDRDGNIIAHGVGRGHDHYLPFNSKHLRQLRKEDGVEYVRRRMFGGPTVEDFHAAMMMGADRLTVVSNGGVFTVDLTRRSHGLKMEHMQVLSRFQELLDEKGSSLNIFGYNEALSALQSEFPLHIQISDFQRGPWADRHDRVLVPIEERLVENLKNALTSLAGDTPSTQKNEWWRGLEVERGAAGGWRMPGQSPGQDARQRYGELIKQGMPRQAALALWADVQRKSGNHSFQSNSWFREQQRLIDEERFVKPKDEPKSSTPGWARNAQTTQPKAKPKPVTPTQTSAPPKRTGLDPNMRIPSGGASEVTTYTDPSLKTAQQAQPTTKMPRISSEVQRRFDQLGYDPTRVSPSDYNRLQQVVAMANRPNWNELLWQNQSDLDILFRVD